MKDDDIKKAYQEAYNEALELALSAGRMGAMIRQFADGEITREECIRTLVEDHKINPDSVEILLDHMKTRTLNDPAKMVRH